MFGLQFTEKGNLASLTYAQLDKPSLQPGQALVAIKATALNPSDVKNVLGLFPATTVPRVAGRDFAGVVVEGPSEWVGKDVFGCALEHSFYQDGSHAELLAINTDALIEKPASLSFTQAASLGIPYATACEVVERAKLKPNAKIVILGAGSVAKAAAKILHSQGQVPVFAARSAAQREALQAAGEVCLDMSDISTLADKVTEQFGELAEFVLDTTGFLIGPAVLSAANLATVAVIAAPASGDITLPVKDFYRRGINMFGVNSLMHNNQVSNDFLRKLLPALADGSLAPEEPRAVPLSQGVAAYQALNDGDSTKTVLVVE